MYIYLYAWMVGFYGLCKYTKNTKNIPYMDPMGNREYF